MVEMHTVDGQDYASFVRLSNRLLKDGYLLFRKELNPIAADLDAEYAWAEMGFLLD